MSAARIHAERREFANTFAGRALIATGIIAASVLAGWFFDLEILKRLGPGFVAMNPMTAVTFILTAIALRFSITSAGETVSPQRQRWIQLCGAALVVIGAYTLAGFFFNFSFGIDLLLFGSKVNAPGAPNRMAPNSALNFILLGGALLFLRIRKRRRGMAACLLALVAGGQACVVLLGYLYGIGTLYGIGSSLPMALHSAVCFVLLSVAIVACQARRRLLLAITANNAAGRMARRLFPAALLIPAVSGWLSLEGQRLGLYQSEFGVALSSVTNMVALGAIIYCSALSLFRTDARRSAAERRLQRAHDQLEFRVRERTEELWSANAALKEAQHDLERRVQERAAKLVEAQSMLHGIADHADSLIYVKDIDGKFVLVNRQVASFFGVPEAEILGRTGHDFYPTESADQFRDNDLAALRAGTTTQFEEGLTKADGVHTFISSKFPLRDASGKTYALGCISTDITAHKRVEDELRGSKRELEIAVEANQLIMDNSKDVIATLDVSGRFLTVSAAAKEVWDYPADDLVGRHYTRIIYPEDIPKMDAMLTRIMAGEAVGDFENRCVRQDGSLMSILWSLSWSQADQKLFIVAHDVSERAQANELLRQAEMEANRANRAKSEFLSRMSHELRTPMNAILGFAQLMEMDELTPQQYEGLTHILRGGRHLLDLINEVLDISRIEAGRLSLSLEPVEISETLQESFDLVRPLAHQRDVRLNAPIGCTCHVLSDRQRLKQVLINLISNAIKYNRPNGTVSVICERRNDCLRVSVMDTGVGIPEDKRNQLFVPFERLGAEHGTIEGTGLGLALAKRLVEAMEGTMGVDSTPGEGSVFWIELPITESPVQLAKLADGPALPTVEHPGGHTVLYIEDNLSNLRLVERLFDHRPSLKLIAANSGGAGLEIARQHHLEVVLLDLNLPDMDGRDVMLRLHDQNPEIPVVVLSADATPGQKALLRDAGAFWYLTKPLDVKKFFEVLDRAIIARPFDEQTNGA